MQIQENIMCNQKKRIVQSKEEETKIKNEFFVTLQGTIENNVEPD